MAKPGLVYQSQVALQGVSPLIWRRIVGPDSWSFWDLHVAIQDSMGWLDYHLHVFELEGAGATRPIEVGIPDDEFDRPTIPGWTRRIDDYFVRPGVSARYTYDFGDDWVHDILLEAVLLPEKSTRYPKCIAGERACPPEDCGGIPGYMDLLKVLRSPKRKECKDTERWLKGHARNYWPYDPERFDAAAVKFSDPKKRWKKAFAAGGH